MTRQVLLRSPPVHRRQPLLRLDNNNNNNNNNNNATTKTTTNMAKTVDTKKSKKFGEVAGGTAAECAAVCCCCPCTVMNLLVLAIYKVPTGLCRKAWRRKKRQRMMKKKSGLLMQKPTTNGIVVGSTGEDLLEKEMKEMKADVADGESEAVDLEDEMWGRFYGAGFWRSPSQRDSTCD